RDLAGGRRHPFRCTLRGLSRRRCGAWLYGRTQPGGARRDTTPLRRSDRPRPVAPAEQQRARGSRSMEHRVSGLIDPEEELNRRHNEKMARRKTARDRMLATKTEERGLLIVHTGKGKGKSTAAF